MTAYHLLLAVHLVLAVFAVGPLVHAATTAGRGIRRGDGTSTASASRVLRIYSYACALVVASGVVLMYRSTGSAAFGQDGVFYGGAPRRYADYLPTGSQHIGEFSQTWIWLSIALWVLATGLVLGLIVPTLDRATKQITAEESIVSLTARVAASGGVVALLYVAIVVLMVYRPGQ